MAEASEKQYAFLEQLSGKDYREFNLTSSEASKKIEEITGKKTEKPAEKPPKATDEMSKGEWAEKDRVKQDSIERQNVHTNVPTTIEIYKKYPDDPLAQANYNYATSKLANWASMGEPPSPSQGKGKPEENKNLAAMIQPEQIDRIKKAAEKYKEHTEEYVGLLKGAYKTSNYTKLTALQAEDLIKRLDRGEGLEIEPADIPF